MIYIGSKCLEGCLRYVNENMRLTVQTVYNLKSLYSDISKTNLQVKNSFIKI